MPSRVAPIRVGVAGWDYKDWKGPFYPKRGSKDFDPLAYVARYVDLIEVNSTFYRPPKAEWTRRWRDRARDAVAERPGDGAAGIDAVDRFRFTIKVWQRFTHQRDEAWSRDELREFKAGVTPLQRADLLSTLLAQFPWSFRNTEENREWLDDVKRAFARWPLVVEVRHESWNEPDFYAWLTEQGIGFVNVDQPLFGKSIKPSARSTARVGYVRVHGRNYHDWFRKAAGRDERYDYLYSREELKPWIDRAQEVAEEAGTEEVDVVFNNHYKAKAVVNALQFGAMLGRDVEAPQRLFDAYGKALDGAGVRPEATDEAEEA